MQFNGKTIARLPGLPRGNIDIAGRIGARHAVSFLYKAAANGRAQPAHAARYQCHFLLFHPASPVLCWSRLAPSLGGGMECRVASHQGKTCQQVRPATLPKFLSIGLQWVRWRTEV